MVHPNQNIPAFRERARRAADARAATLSSPAEAAAEAQVQAEPPQAPPLSLADRLKAARQADRP